MVLSVVEAWIDQWIRSKLMMFSIRINLIVIPECLTGFTSLLSPSLFAIPMPNRSTCIPDDLSKCLGGSNCGHSLQSGMFIFQSLLKEY